MARSGLVMLAVLAVGACTASSLAQGRVEMRDPGSGWRANGFRGGAFRAVQVSGYNGILDDPSVPGSNDKLVPYVLSSNEARTSPSPRSPGPRSAPGR